MGITKYGIWIFFKDKESAQNVAKELSTMMNRYGVFIMDKLKVDKENSFKFFLSSKQAIEEVSWKFNNYKFIWVDRGEGWEMDSSTDDFFEEGEERLRKFASQEVKE